MNDLRARFCVSCGSDLPGVAKFCPGCGVRIGHEPVRRTPMTYAAVALAATLIGGGAWAMQGSLAGTKPTRQYVDTRVSGEKAGQGMGGGHVKSGGHGTAAPDPVIQELKAKAQEKPGDPEGWRAVVSAVLEKMNAEPAKASELAFDAIDALSRLLAIDANDTQALLAMGDISFNQQAFTKAEEFYRRYLVHEPTDLDTRARYGSTLTFLGRGNEALTELKNVLAVKPDHFHASAYLAISYAETGDFENALKQGQRVVEIAPNEEAKSRFEGFLASVRERIEEGGAEPTKSTAAAHTEDAASAVIAKVKASPVAGPKYETHTVDGSTVEIFMRDFPMSAMPPFIKEKFLTGLKEAGTGGSIKTIVLKDAENGSELARVTL